MKHLNYTTAKPLDHEALGGVFLFFHLEYAYQSVSVITISCLLPSQRGAGVITVSRSVEPSKQSDPNRVNSTHITYRKHHPGVSVINNGTIIIRGKRKEIKLKMEASGMFFTYTSQF